MQFCHLPGAAFIPPPGTVCLYRFYFPRHVFSLIWIVFIPFSPWWIVFYIVLSLRVFKVVPPEGLAGERFFTEVVRKQM